jgi:uncharacterized protein (DUF1501 family)
MSNEQEKINRWFKQHPWNHQTFFNRPHATRRHFLELVGAGVTASLLAGHPAKAAAVAAAGVTTKNTAQNVIFILMAGAPSHTDTFDFKMVDGTTPASFAPETIGSMYFPVGLMPKLATLTGDFAIARNVHAHAVVHSVSQTWVQIGRNPLAALGNIAPNIGSIVAAERYAQRKPSDIFPTFLALNSSGGVSQGYLSGKYAPFKVTPSTAGIANTTSATGSQTRFESRFKLLDSLDANLRTNAPNGVPMSDYNEFYIDAKELMYNPVVNQYFGYPTSESTRYGGTSTGNAMLVASQVLKANLGTRFIQITSNDGWDMHTNIYTGAGSIQNKAKIIDDGLSELINDLKANGLFDQTLIVMYGEFGRTVGPITAQQGRDHWPQQFCFFAGGGIKGGLTVGQTDAQGKDTIDYGWSQNRYVYPEDIEATIYSALGIDWTTVRHDDPLGRGFEYVPTTGPFPYMPVHELWG